MSLLSEMTVSAITHTALAGGEIITKVRLNDEAIVAMGLDPEDIADVDLQIGLYAADTGIASVAAIAMAPVPGLDGKFWVGTVVVGAAALAVGVYYVKVFLNADLDSTDAAQEDGAPEEIDKDDIDPVIAMFTLT